MRRPIFTSAKNYLQKSNLLQILLVLAFGLNVLVFFETEAHFLILTLLFISVLIGTASLRLLGISLNFTGIFLLPTYGASSNFIDPHQFFAILGTLILLIWLAPGRWRNIHLTHSALFLTVLLALQLTPNYVGALDFAFSAGRTTTLLVLALALFCEDKREPLYKSVLIAAVLIGLTSPVLVAAGLQIDSTYFTIREGARFGGLVGHPNFISFSAILIGTAVLSPGFIQKTKGHSRLCLSIGIFFLSCLVVFVGGSLAAAATLTLVSTMVAVSWVRGKRAPEAIPIKSSRYSIPSAMAASFSLAFLATHLTGSSVFVGRVGTQITGTITLGNPIPTDLGPRFRYWEEHLASAGPLNWLGGGAGAHKYAVESGIYPHSSYVQIYVDYGWLGVLFLALFLVGLVNRAKKGIADAKDFSLSFLVIAFGGLTEATMFHPAVLTSLIIAERIYSQGMATNRCVRSDVSGRVLDLLGKLASLKGGRKSGQSSESNSDR